MAPRPGWPRAGQRAPYIADTRRWLVALAVLAIAGGVHLGERWMRSPGARIVGHADVADGDTLTISGTRIRLVGIDTPELSQVCKDADGRDWSCGREASNQLRSKIRGHELSCAPQSRDQYGRALAICSLPDKTDINGWLVRQGWAVSYDRADTYAAEQSEAKSARRGIWAGTFMTPREWRRQNPRMQDERKN